VRAIIFSKDRPLQLDGCLRSLYRHCLDIASIEVAVLFKAETPEDAALYAEVERAWGSAVFVPEVDLAVSLTSWFLHAGYCLFVVDDCVFWRDFTLADARGELERTPQAIGFSLRLGRNITHSYIYNRPLVQPVLSEAAGILSWHWEGSDEAWGYPLEVSSSLYHEADVLPLLGGASNPNGLESLLARAPDTSKPVLLSYAESVAYDVQINRVGPYPNRVGADPRYTADALKRAYAGGWRLDVEGLPSTSAVMQEIELPLVKETIAL
jgi:hypothetical protein